jgi:hypothetical protein
MTSVDLGIGFFVVKGGKLSRSDVADEDVK